jgi:hypothetical protein
MKKSITLLLSISLFFTIQTYSQCNDYYVLEMGLEWEYESFNAKGKTTGKQHQKVTKYEVTSSGFKANLQVDMVDKKGKELTSGELELTCEDGVMQFDMRKFVPEEQLKALGSYEMKVEAENLEYPSNLSVGQTLKDGSITVTTVGSPMQMKITVNIVQRKVEAIESITTPAGTFEAMKISSKSIIKNQMGISMTFEFDQIEWLAKEVGMVKSESFKKGKLNSYSLLVKRN